MTRSRDLANLADSTEFTAALNTKLTNIETAATADQTNAEIKTAVQANSDIALAGNPTTTTQSQGNNSTRLATTAYTDVAIAALADSAPSTLNTLNELAAALGDDAAFSTTVTNSIATKLPLAGGAVTGDVTFGDNNKAVFGAGSDLKIYHSGSSSIIDNTTGGLFFNQWVDNADITFQNDDSTGGTTTYLLMQGSTGEVQLKHYGSTKISTKATGVEVTGNMIAKGYLASEALNSTNKWLAYTYTDNTFRLNYNGAGGDEVTITSDGKIGIGVGNTAPTATLHVVTPYSEGIRFSDSTGTPYSILQSGSGYAGIGTNSLNEIISWRTNDNLGKVGIGTVTPSTKLQITHISGDNAAHASYGHPNTGGVNGSLYIDSANSRIDWDGGIVFAGEGNTWSARFTGRHGLTVNSDTDGEIFGVHPVEGNGTTYNHTAAADGVTAAYLRVMGNGKTFVDKLYAEDALVAPTHATDTAANTAGANVAGSIYFNSTFNVHRAYNGSNWQNVSSAPITESVFDAFGDGSALCLIKANNSNLDTGGTHNASLVGGVAYTTTAKFGSHSFNAMGAGVYVDIPTLPLVETLSLWWHCVGNSHGYIVDFRHDTPSNGRSYLYTHSGGGDQKIHMGTDTTTSNKTGIIYINGALFSSGQYNFTSGTWYHIVLVRNATDTHRNWDQGVRLGNRSDGSTEGDAGYFDQIRAFNRQISASEALALYNEIA